MQRTSNFINVYWLRFYKIEKRAKLLETFSCWNMSWCQSCWLHIENVVSFGKMAKCRLFLFLYHFFVILCVFLLLPLYYTLLVCYMYTQSPVTFFTIFNPSWNRDCHLWSVFYHTIGSASRVKNGFYNKKGNFGYFFWTSKATTRLAAFVTPLFNSFFLPLLFSKQSLAVMESLSSLAREE